MARSFALVPQDASNVSRYQLGTATVPKKSSQPQRLAAPSELGAHSTVKLMARCMLGTIGFTTPVALLFGLMAATSTEVGQPTDWSLFLPAAGVSALIFASLLGTTLALVAFARSMTSRAVRQRLERDVRWRAFDSRQHRDEFPGTGHVWWAAWVDEVKAGALVSLLEGRCSESDNGERELICRTVKQERLKTNDLPRLAETAAAYAEEARDNEKFGYDALVESEIEKRRARELEAHAARQAEEEQIAARIDALGTIEAVQKALGWDDLVAEDVAAEDLLVKLCPDRRHSGEFPGERHTAYLVFARQVHGTPELVMGKVYRPPGALKRKRGEVCRVVQFSPHEYVDMLGQAEKLDGEARSLEDRAFKADITATSQRQQQRDRARRAHEQRRREQQRQRSYRRGREIELERDTASTVAAVRDAITVGQRDWRD